VQSTDASDAALLHDERGYVERTHRANAVVGIKIRELTKVRGTARFCDVGSSLPVYRLPMLEYRAQGSGADPGPWQSAGR